jgi:GR25 family glycosyltransferase involved in LPS biosynthesis
MKYIVDIVTTTDHSIFLKNTALRLNIYSLIEPIFKWYDNKNIYETLNELNRIISIYKKDLNICPNLIKFWHVIYDYTTVKHKSSLFSVPMDKIEELTKSITQKTPEKDVIITMTTCKRMDLAYRTINSMLNCITDLSSNIGEFIIIDDNSSEEDRNALEKVYPFVTLIRKSTDLKGHPQSMNILLEKIKGYKYQFHIEDDWEFFYPLDYITKCKKVLSMNSNYGQCLVNRDYGEDQLTINNIGGSEAKLYEDGIYYEHRHFKGEQLQKELQRINVSNNLYWPHFSFRVGLTLTSVYTKVGKFNEQSKHFEMEYGERYTSCGYLTTFLDRVYCTHIGRRTYERNDMSKTNAYELNDEQQFGEGGKKEFVNKNKENINISTYVVNLKRRKDRLLKFMKENIKELSTFKVVEAVDGSVLKANSKTQRLFQTGDYRYRRGIMGVAYSMIKIWKEFVTDSESDIAVIFEDDIKLTPKYVSKLIYLINENYGKFDVILGHMNLYPHSNSKEYYDLESQPKLIKYTTDRMMRDNMGSLAVTILTKKGASNLLSEVKEKGVYNAIDWVVMKTCDKQDVYVSVPFLGFADCYQSNMNKDTDIQKDYNVCSLDNWLQFEIDYWKKVLTKGKKNVRVVYIKSSNLVEYLRKNKVECIECKSMNEVKQNDIFISSDMKVDNLLKQVSIYPLKAEWNGECINKYYNIDVCKIVVPFYLLNDEILSDKSWEEGYLNLVNV